MRANQVLLLLFLAIGVAAVSLAALSALETRTFVAEAVRAEGVVVALERHTFHLPWMIEKDRSLQSDETHIVPVFEFRDRAGHANRFAGRSYWLGYRVGEHVTVLYSPQDPQRARIDSVIALWGGALALLGVGLVFTAGSVFALIGPDRERIDPPSVFQ